MEFVTDFIRVILDTTKDVAPVLAFVIFFQLYVLKEKIPHLVHVVVGSVLVILGLTFFLLGLEMALFPVGRSMAAQLTDPAFIENSINLFGQFFWDDYLWVYVFAAFIGFATTIAEPSLLAVAIKAEEVSSGTINKNGLRIAVALGVAVGITLGAFRIVHGSPLQYYIMVGYIIVVIQTLYAPKKIIPLAYDSGGVTTSTVTVPIVAALGLGLAEAIPGRDPLLDGFGLIAFASLFPMISVMGYAMHAEYSVKRKMKKLSKGENE